MKRYSQNFNVFKRFFRFFAFLHVFMKQSVSYRAIPQSPRAPGTSAGKGTSFSIFRLMYDPRFLPICTEDLDELGWDYVDVIIISADAYVDHPCFGHAVVGRLFQHEGLRVAILPQPNWRDDLRDFKKLGRPRMFFAISSGMDSMVNTPTQRF